jgi:hypothetical protein
MEKRRPSSDPDLLSAREAARLIGVGTPHFRSLARDYGLAPVWPDGTGGPCLFHKEDVFALAELREKRYGLAEVSALSLQNNARLRALERQIQELSSLLGAVTLRLPHEPDGVRALVAEAKARTCTNPSNLSPESLKLWGARLRAIDDGYLRLIAEVLATDEPWRPFYELADKLVALVLQRKPDDSPRLRQAFGWLLHARDVFRATAYFYVRGRFGRRTAADLFNERDVDDQVIALGTIG